MKKIFFLTLMLIPFINFAQSANVLQTESDGYCTYIRPSFFNVIKILFMPNSTFVKTMNDYNYIETASGIGYMAQTTSRSHFRIIKKDSRSVIMNFSPNNVDLISKFRNEIKNAIKEPTVQYENGYETYRLLIPYDGIKYKVTFRLKEEERNEYFNGQNINYSNGSLIVMID